MKKLILLGLIILAVVAYTSNNPEVSQLVDPTVKHTNTPTPQPSAFIENEGLKYNYSYFVVEDNAKLSLISNFEQQSDSKLLMEQNKCSKGINGGFYSEQNEPIGAFVTNFEEVGKFRQNTLFNGFVSIDQNNKSNIKVQSANEKAKILLQTGPLLILDSKVLELSMIRDRQARRMVAAKNNKGQLVFLTIYSFNSMLDGPLLAELGKNVKAISDTEKLNLVDAINLDGGAASAFHSNETVIDEWQPVGSWWCLQS